MDFHDRNKWITFIKLAEMMRRASHDPSMILDARQFVEQHMAPDPHQHRYVEMWRALLSRPVEEIAQRLLAETSEGELLRDTAPVFGKGLASREVFDLIEACENKQ